MWYRRNRSLIITCAGWCNCLVGAACPLPGGWYSWVENVLFWKSTAGPRPSRWYSWPENTTCLFMRLIVILTIAPGKDSSLTSPRFNAHGRSSEDCPRSLATAVFAVQSADCQRRNAREVLTRRLKSCSFFFSTQFMLFVEFVEKSRDEICQTFIWIQTF